MTVTILNYDNEILNKLKKILKLAKKKIIDIYSLVTFQFHII
jgi:hypothetical protein